MAPDGVERLMMVYNNSYPGPLLTANWGDWIVVHVTNNLQNNGLLIMIRPDLCSTSIHWHGIIQESNGANDGVPGITQCNGWPQMETNRKAQFLPAHHLRTASKQPGMAQLGTIVISRCNTQRVCWVLL